MNNKQSSEIDVDNSDAEDIYYIIKNVDIMLINFVRRKSACN